MCGVVSVAGTVGENNERRSAFSYSLESTFGQATKDRAELTISIPLLIPTSA